MGCDTDRARRRLGNTRMLMRSKCNCRQDSQQEAQTRYPLRYRRHDCHPMEASFESIPKRQTNATKVYLGMLVLVIGQTRVKTKHDDEFKRSALQLWTSAQTHRGRPFQGRSVSGRELSYLLRGFCYKTRTSRPGVLALGNQSGERASLTVVSGGVVLSREPDGRWIGPSRRVLFLKRKTRVCRKSANIREVVLKFIFRPAFQFPPNKRISLLLFSRISGLPSYRKRMRLFARLHLRPSGTLRRRDLSPRDG